MPNFRLLACLTALLACGPKPETRVAERPPEAAPAGDASAWNRAFTVGLHRELASTNDNLVLSPASLQLALAMAWAGSRGATSEQMAKALQVDSPQEQAHREFQKQADGWKSETGPYTLAMANRVFVQQSYALQPDFEGLLRRHYGAGFEALDFDSAPQLAERRINAWVAEATRDEIKTLLPRDSMTSYVRAVLANAAYFKGTWQTKFKAEHTRPEPFSLAKGEVVRVPTMRATLRARHARLEGTDARALELDYAGDRFSMVLLLPAEPTGLPALETALTAASLESTFRALRPARIDVMLPRFSIDFGPAAVKPILARLGMPLAFTRRADFSGMAGKPGDLWISDVYHRARVQVDEEGTVAAAASGLAMTTKSFEDDEPLEFHIDRPFLFLIRDERLDAVLFVGRVGDPRS